jgi:hypothetical protein
MNYRKRCINYYVSVITKVIGTVHRASVTVSCMLSIYPGKRFEVESSRNGFFN